MCSSEEEKPSCLTSPSAACRKATWFGLYCHSEEANQELHDEVAAAS